MKKQQRIIVITAFLGTPAMTPWSAITIPPVLTMMMVFGLKLGGSSGVVNS